MKEIERENNLEKAVNALNNEQVPSGPSRELVNSPIAKLTEISGQTNTFSNGKRIRFIDGVCELSAGKFTIVLNVEELLTSLERIELEEVREAILEEMESRKSAIPSTQLDVSGDEHTSDPEGVVQEDSPQKGTFNTETR